MKRTPLYNKHLALNAKIASFGGYEMPIQYKSIVFEHNATRQAASIFDTCHMGEFSFCGPNALGDLERVLSSPVGSMKIGQCRYGFICNEAGGVIDDQILYRMGENEFFMVVNASTESNDFHWISDHLSRDTITENLSAQTAKIDLQGPASPKICAKLMEEPIGKIPYYHFTHNRYRGERVLLSRTGYTGEIGFEFYSTPELALKFWDDCLAAGAVPAGLGARDTLRLEMGYPLYGHELDEATNAAWSGFTRALGEKAFIGSGAIRAEGGRAYRLCGLLIDGRRTAHSGNVITTPAGEEVGRITSGSFSPSLGHAIALGYLRDGYQQVGAVVSITTDRGALQATISETPLYRKASGRADIENYL
ncbi:MAG: glycine cleavage system aminomethyltransferase GcvT [Chitinispirillaceae bacterium]|nr:glycine cleavage system aminomethyltransferase GcvT [Chitinispirillaceae bacterium]